MQSLALPRAGQGPCEWRKITVSTSNGLHVWGSRGMRLLDKIMILQGVGQTIQPLEVGYANSPKHAQKGGYVALSPMYRPVWL